MPFPRVDDASEQPVPNTPTQFTSSKFGSSNGSSPELGEMCGRSGPTTEEQFKELRDMSGPLVRSGTNFGGHVQTISSSVVLLTSRITNVEQIFNAFSIKMAVFETGGGAAGALSAPSVYLDVQMARWLHTVTRALRTKIGIQGAGSTQTRTQMMKMHEVPHFTVSQRTMPRRHVHMA